MTPDEVKAKAEEWLVKTPLYEEIAGSDPGDCYNAIRALFMRAAPFDAHCVECKGAATFTPEHDEERRGLILRGPREIVERYCMEQTLFTVRARCARNAAHHMQFVFLHRLNKGLQKIGQYPSLADLSIPETSQFVKVLGEDRVRELNKAIGLAAHGVGVGSYIYLRRIFESLVEEAHGEARNDVGWDEEAYQRLRVSERVPILKAHLPAFLVEHPQLYGILSKHIHELSEDECRRNFDAMKEAILIIARDKLKAHDEMEHRKHTAKLLQQIGSTMKG
jgi:hypothetical protein